MLAASLLGHACYGIRGGAKVGPGAGGEGIGGAGGIDFGSGICSFGEGALGIGVNGTAVVGVDIVPSENVWPYPLNR